MSLLEVITKASSAIASVPDQGSRYPIVFNPDPIFSKLKPESDAPVAGDPVRKAIGWEVSEIDSELVELGRGFFKRLKKKLNSANPLTKVSLIDMIVAHLEKVGDKIGVSLNLNKSEKWYPYKLMEKLGILLGRDAKELILEGCIVSEVWDLLGVLIVNGIVEHSLTSSLISKLIENRKSDLLLLCVKHSLDLHSHDILSILRYFLILPDDGFESLVSVKEDWERQALSAIEKACGGKGVGGKDNILAKEAAQLIMLAYDGFSVSEFCLHHLLVSPNLDEVTFSACVGRLNGEEIKVLVRYLGKWLRKYERFPQVMPCPKAASVLGLTVCDWIPSLENVTKCLSVVVDEHFSSLILQSEFDDLKSLVEIVGSLAVEARLCGTLANLAENLKMDRKES
ncbi:uncharacterized protein LOC127246012 [Andrographis paniculata]|uniref:uncharacterized protein LOC127246012 n=1 Tax=Andrographis paniculata TaxID=175694 RepID=UPI0021E93188|nr:uncharacterized protein LOC127246012 [Andrographis paniculata]